MKWLIFALTIFMHLMAVAAFKLLDNFWGIVLFILGGVVVGFILEMRKKQIAPDMRPVGWGLLYGSLTAIGILFGFMAWLMVVLT